MVSPYLQRALCLYASLLLGLGLGGAVPAAAQIFKLPYPDTLDGTFFGGAVALDGDRALVGASGEDVEGDNAGAAYVFERDSTTGLWQQAARLLPNDSAPGTFFGRALALDGDRALVAASGEFFSAERPNAVYVFERDTSGTWRQTARLQPNRVYQEGGFGAFVALDGDRALVTTWGDVAEGRYGGAAYVYEYEPDTGDWREAARLVGSGGVKRGVFGGAGALDGDRIAVAASGYLTRRKGSVYVFERGADSIWREAARLDDFGDFRIALDLEGDRLLVGESKAGRDAAGEALLFERAADGTWARRGRLRPSLSYALGGFGSAVSLGGAHALATGYDEQLQLDTNIDRVVYVFAYDAEADAWRQRRIVDVGEVAFGSAIDHEGDYALIGQASDTGPGAAYIVRLR